MSEEKKQREVQQKVMELQMLQQQAQQVQRQAQMLDQQAGEMDLVQQALDDFTQAKVGSDMFVTLTPGVFAKAKLQGTDTVILNVGGGAMVEKSIPDAKQVIAAQGVELRKLQQELMEQLQKIAERAEKTQTDLRAIVK